MRTLCVLLALCLSSVSIGCGDDEDGEARPRYRSGVTPMTSTTTVSTLDEDDKEQLCASLDAHVQVNVGFDAIARISCLPAAIVLGGSPQGCQAQLDQCVRAFPAPIAVEAQVQDTQVCFADLDQCNATVAALETCVNVNLDIIFDILDNFSCQGAGNAATRDDAQRVMDTVNVCADLNAACNNFATINRPD